MKRFSPKSEDISNKVFNYDKNNKNSVIKPIESDIQLNINSDNLELQNRGSSKKNELKGFCFKYMKFNGIILIFVMIIFCLLFQILAVLKQNDICSKKNNYNKCNDILIKNCSFFIKNRKIVKNSECCDNPDCLCKSDIDLYKKLSFICRKNFDNSQESLNTAFLFFIGLFVIMVCTNTIFYIRRKILLSLDLEIEEVKHIDIYSRGFREKYKMDKENFKLSVEKLLQFNNRSKAENKILIRCIDFFGRKTLHFISLMLFTYLDAIIFGKDLVPSLRTFITLFFTGFLISGLMWFSIDLPNKIKPYLLPILYGGYNRIQDGVPALLNMITALIVGSFKTIILGIIITYFVKDIVFDYGIKNNKKYEDINKLYLLSWIITNNGVIFGDTAGEGIGAFMGKHRFRVHGFRGQENERSLEGCFGVFLFTCISDIIGIIFFSDLFKIKPIMTILFIFSLSLGTMLLEMVSFKGTDNLVITLYSILIVIIWFKYIF